MADGRAVVEVELPQRLRRFSLLHPPRPGAYFVGDSLFEEQRIAAAAERAMFCLRSTLDRVGTEARLSIGGDLLRVLSRSPEQLAALQTLVREGRCILIGRALHDTPPETCSTAEFSRQVEGYRNLLREAVGVHPVGLQVKSFSHGTLTLYAKELELFEESSFIAQENTVVAGPEALVRIRALRGELTPERGAPLNRMQRRALDFVRELEVLCGDEDRELWRRLSSYYHIAYLGTLQEFPFSPYESPYEAFINFISVLEDVRLRICRNPSRMTGMPNLL